MIDDASPSLSKVRILIHLYVFVLTNGWWSMPNWYSRAVFNICSELTNYPNNFQTDLVISQFVLYSYSDVVTSRQSIFMNCILELLLTSILSLIILHKFMLENEIEGGSILLRRRRCGLQPILLSIFQKETTWERKNFAQVDGRGSDVSSKSRNFTIYIS